MAELTSKGSNMISCATSTTIISLWQTFLERVDPVLKIIHVPTIQQKIMDVVTGRVSASVEFKTLIDAICYSAVITMSVEECQRFHNKEREEFLSG
ncbi:hypothetical protein N7478_002113 [Penicillium angulare]|uniref:uncharacterized protein n=1 Tax=Penicillium angulare TaxID=116970 RepID=UPI00254107FF|nr:uncharacterized protein N7478_002113 [Penicillium angulare]KAJ5289083.1 hypothetical protein N7478_002113 [Penicillium angulare]